MGCYLIMYFCGIERGEGGYAERIRIGALEDLDRGARRIRSEKDS